MPINAAQDLNYQPKVDSYNYTPPKIFFLVRLFSSLIKLIKKQKKVAVMLLIILILTTASILIINYLNIFSLSFFFPKIFSHLPHKYDVAANSIALENVTYSTDLSAYQLVGDLYSASSDRVSVEYQGKVVEFLIENQLSCGKKVVNETLEDKIESSYDTVFCDDLLSRTNYGKKVVVTYLKTSSGFYIIDIELNIAS